MFSDFQCCQDSANTFQQPFSNPCGGEDEGREVQHCLMSASALGRYTRLLVRRLCALLSGGCAAWFSCSKSRKFTCIPRPKRRWRNFFVKSAKKDPGHSFIIETHGDSIIDRIRICVSNGIIPPEDVVILYFERQPRKLANVKIHPIRMDKNANLLDVPAGYRDFFMAEGDRLLGFEKLPKS